MGLLSYMRSVVDRNVVMRRIPVGQNISVSVQTVISILTCLLKFVNTVGK